MNTIEEKLNELLKFYKNFSEIEKTFNINKHDLDDELIEKIFNIHCEKNSIEIEVGELFTKYKDKRIYVNSLDGYNKINRIFKKPKRKMYQLSTKDYSIKCSYDHLIETPEGFIKTENLNINSFVVGEKGNQVILSKEKIEDSIVYDFEINHINHRYLCGGFSNHNTGKTFLCLNIAKNAQKKGYKIIWIDSEKAADDLMFERFGIDTTSMIYIDDIDTVNRLSTFLVNFVDALQEAKAKNVEVDKYIVIIDSLANLSTDKEIKDVQTGSDKADMTRPKELRRLFRVCTSKLGRIDIPVIITNHVYASIDMFTHGNTMSGGGGPAYNGSIIVELFKSQLKETTDSAATGIVVRSVIKKSRFSKSNIPIKFHISFYKGMNPYVGLDDYVDWETCGIGWGKIEKGEFMPTTTGRTIAVKHLEKHISPKELFTNKVFTKEIIKELDKKIQKVFELPKSNDLETELEDIANIIELEKNEVELNETEG
jgi:RecA/RadA recombinase